MPWRHPSPSGAGFRCRGSDLATAETLSSSLRCQFAFPRETITCEEHTPSCWRPLRRPLVSRWRTRHQALRKNKPSALTGSFGPSSSLGVQGARHLPEGCSAHRRPGKASAEPSPAPAFRGLEELRHSGHKPTTSATTENATRIQQQILYENTPKLS